MCLFKCITGLFCEKRIAVNVLPSPKNFCNMQKRTFILLFRPFEPNWVRKRLFLIRSEILGLLDNTLTANYEYSRIIERIYCYQIKPIIIKIVNFCSNFFCIFGITIKFPMFWKKNEPHSSNISEVIDSERCCLLKCIKRLFLWKAYCSERVNESQKFLQYAEKNFYPTFRPFEPNWVRKGYF